MDFTQAAKIRYRHKNSLFNLVKQIKEKLNYETDTICPEVIDIFNYILNTDPCSYWNDEVRLQTINKLEDIYDSSPVNIDYEMLEHFFIGYHTYTQATQIINDISGLNDSQLIKTRMYRIPTYISILEGCLTNLFRFICLVINSVSEQDYSKQKKLGPLCDVLKSNGLEEITTQIDIDIRNAINHGGVIIHETDRDIEFHYTKQNKVCVKKLSVFDFERLIDNIYDIASGILLAICQFINNHIENICIDRKEASYVSFNLMCMELSIPGIRCTTISDIADNKQMNINVDIENTDRVFIIQTAFELLLQIYSIYPQYQQYFILFNHPRVLIAWVRITGEEISDIISRNREISEVLQSAIDRHDVNITDPSNEDIDLQEIKFFRFPNYHHDNIKINNVQDASIEERKRLKAHLFVGDTTDKNEILKAINEAVDWIKTLKNPPSPKTMIRHGIMEADSIYLNVYKYDNRRDKNLFINNENFICMVDYNVDGETVIKTGGVPANLWNQYFHEKIGNLFIAWRSKEYKPPKVGRNDPCPCGSGKKYKKCCGQTNI